MKKLLIALIACCLAAGLAGLLVLALAFSAEFSRQHFYPYPAYSVGTESGA